MSTRNLTLAAAALYALTGPLLAVTIWALAGWLAAGAVVAGWAGVGGALAALLLAARDQRRALRRLERRVDRATAAVAALEPAVSEDRLAAALNGLEERLDTRQEATADTVRQHVDARVLGLQAMVREVAETTSAHGKAAG